VAVDPVNDVIAVVNDQSILIFDRNASGDVAPLRSLGGQRIALGTRNGTRDVQLFPGGKKIIAGGVIKASGQTGSERISMLGPWAGYSGAGQRFLGVWRYDDEGEIAPWAMLNANSITQIPGNRLAINPAGGDLIVADAGQISVYHVPEIFRIDD
jgi:hypothetical protein